MVRFTKRLSGSKECRSRRLRDGESKHTSDYDLSTKFVIHAVGVIWASGNHHEAELLAACYRECMAIAVARGLKSIAFSPISCSVYGNPIAKARKITIIERCYAQEHCYPRKTRKARKARKRLKIIMHMT